MTITVGPPVLVPVGPALVPLVTPAVAADGRGIDVLPPVIAVGGVGSVLVGNGEGVVVEGAPWRLVPTDGVAPNAELMLDAMAC